MSFFVRVAPALQAGIWRTRRFRLTHRRRPNRGANLKGWRYNYSVLGESTLLRRRRARSSTQASMNRAA